MQDRDIGGYITAADGVPMSHSSNQIEFIMGHEDAVLPKKAHPDDTGLDLHSVKELTIYPEQFAKVPTGLYLSYVPPNIGMDLQVRPRSGLAAKYGVTVLNSPGTIDQSYRGEICVLLINHGPRPFKVNVGDRIAQLVIGSYFQHREVTMVVKSEHDVETERGEGGFGSTGK